jgi:sigma-E factor negative regulatory protein RseC
MEETGIVKSVDGINARVLVSRKNSCCESCEKDSCDIPENGIETEALNAAGAGVGQKVKVVMKTYTYIKGTLLFYAFPVMALFAGAISGKVYLPFYINSFDSELLSAIGGFFAFITSLLVVKLIMSGMNKKTQYKSVIEEIIS